MERLIWLAEVPFDGHPHRQPQLARRLAERFEVVFVEPPPPLRAPRGGTRLRQGVYVGQAAPLLNARPAPLRLALHVPAVRRLAVRLGAGQLSRLARSDRGAPRRPIVVCSNVYLAAAAAVLRPRLTVVDMCDDPRHYPGEPSWAHQLLVDCVQKADLVTTSSRWLEAEFRAMGARRVEHLPNGVTEDQLLPIPVSRGRNSEAMKVIGFVGHFGPWIDLELLERVAATLPEARLALVGSVDPALQPVFARLIRRSNVDYRGFVAHAEVPSLIASFDVGLMPFKLSEYTRAVNPIKLYEYAAQNVPIVSTAFSQDVEAFRDWIDVCTTSTEFVDAVANRVKQGICRPIRWIAEAHTWGALATRFAGLIDETRPSSH